MCIVGGSQRPECGDYIRISGTRNMRLPQFSAPVANLHTPQAYSAYPAYSKEIAYKAMIRFLTIINLGDTRLFRAMLSFAVLLVVLAAGVSAQQPDEVIRTDTSLVQLN